MGRFDDYRREVYDRFLSKGLTALQAEHETSIFLAGPGYTRAERLRAEDEQEDHG